MGREGPVLYCKDNTGALVKVLIPEEKLCFTPVQLVKLCCAMLPLYTLLVEKS